MKTIKLFSILLAALAVATLLIASCKHTAQEPAKPDLAQIRTEIQAMENAYADGLKAKDANAVIAYYADDAISMVNNAPIAAGHDAILKVAQDEIASDTTNTTVSFETVDLYAAGDLVVETGKATYKDPSGNVAKTAKYMKLFEKRNGKYLAIRDIYNDDKK